MSEKKGLKIIEFKAENVKKLKVVEIKPKDNTVVISGRNEQGKSSILDAIWYALGGGAASKGLKKPIREGAESAEVKIDLGDIIVTRKWSSNTKSTLIVENRDGSRFQSPQAILDELIGNLSFDPLAFSNMKDSEQRETLLDLVDIDLDLKAWEVDRQTAYDDRTAVNRTVKELEGQLAGIPVSEEEVPDEEVSASTILDEVAAAQLVKDKNDEERVGLINLRKGLSSLEEDIVGVDNNIASLVEQLAAAEKLKETLKGNVKHNKQTLMQLNAEVTALEDPDMDSFQVKLKNIEETNKAVRDKKKRSGIELKLIEERKSSQNHTDNIDALDTKKSDAIEAAEFPIKHLGFDETGVTYKNIPFGQCSAAESLRVSLSIAIAINPKLRVLRITDGSLLDSKNMAIIQDMVKEHDFQCWIEVVDESGKMGIYIEDGEIKNEKEEG